MHRSMFRAERLALALVVSAGGALLGGCYQAHEPVLLGERYRCLCTYDRRPLECADWIEIDDLPVCLLGPGEMTDRSRSRCEIREVGEGSPSKRPRC